MITYLWFYIGIGEEIISIIFLNNCIQNYTFENLVSLQHGPLERLFSNNSPFWKSPSQGGD